MAMRKFPSLDIPEFRVFKKLESPQKIQSFLESLSQNFEPHGGTCRSPLMTLRRGEAHCMEGALLAAAILWYHGQEPLLLDLRTPKEDDDHVVTLFRDGKHWGALSKTNHGVLRYRDAIYASPRELAMSYFHEYFLNSNGKKTLREYSLPFSLLRYDNAWLTSPKHLWNISDGLDASPHKKILTPAQIKKLRPATNIEIRMGEIVEWKPPRKR